MKKIKITLLATITLLLNFCTQNASSQITDLVPHQGITSSLHQENIGQITFSEHYIPLEDYQESDFITALELTDNSNLNIRAFFDNALTNYLHQLAPDLSSEKLLEKGNYQFSFYVNGNLLYKENLNTGAGLPHEKNEHTYRAIPLISTKNEDSWGRFLWMRFYWRNGGEAALKTGTNTLKIEIRPYIKHNGLKVGEVIARGEIQLKWAEPAAVDEWQIAIQPIQANSGWAISKATYNKDKIRALNEKIAQNKFKDIASVVVIKDGELLIEEYFNGADRSTLHNVRSVGKTFASTMVGIAIEDGHLKDMNQTLSEFYDLNQFDNYTPQKAKVTLKSLMTMSSGFDGTDSDYSSPGHEERMYPTDDWVKFTLDLGMDKTRKMGETWDYFTAGAMLVGQIVHQSVPGGFEAYTHEKLFQPLGITNYQWPYTPKKVPSTAGGISMRALDFAKYGQLYKNKGHWKGQQILPEDWVKKSLTNYFSDYPDQTPYGLLLWNKFYEVEGQAYEVFQCEGNGGNKIIIFNDQPLVIVITATAYNQPYGHSQVTSMMEEYLLPAILNP